MCRLNRTSGSENERANVTSHCSTKQKEQWQTLFCVLKVASLACMYVTQSTDPLLFFVDDGKLFQGSGVGDAFGPRCFEGDIMGCGIMFPRDYSLDGGSEHHYIVSKSTVPHHVQSLIVFLGSFR